MLHTLARNLNTAIPQSYVGVNVYVLYKVATPTKNVQVVVHVVHIEYTTC